MSRLLSLAALALLGMSCTYQLGEPPSGATP